MFFRQQLRRSLAEVRYLSLYKIYVRKRKYEDKEEEEKIIKYKDSPWLPPFATDLR